MNKLSFVIALLAFAAGCTQAAPPPAGSSGPDPKNELPFGFVDSPKAGDSVERVVQAYGWALDDGSIKEIRCFVDGHFVGRTTMTAPRPDVVKAYPSYLHGSDVHGWAMSIPLGATAAAGNHTIVVQAVDNLDATRDIGTVEVNLAR
ncbi:MAG: hypothetical protein HY048_02080 [Acidobacteria bacterium]|nr:hypothetical protein [Acidobacteriota bacterium]